jgi:folate-dependent phosphoribosylglycinamide formyltransferase PurN
LLQLEAELGEQRYRERAAQCIEFLRRIQLPDGGFPGLEIAMNTTDPSPFNTAQIVNGLTAWYRETGDEEVLDSARRATDWLLSIQGNNGVFAKNFYSSTVATYSAHLSCWIAELGQEIQEQQYLDSAERHLDWVLSHHDEATGWFDLCGFGDEEHESRIAVTHTIAYTIWGVLLTSEILGRDDGIAAARQAADGVLRRLELSRWIPGVLNSDWQGRASFACLTGNAQMALIWFRLYRRFKDPRYVSAAFKALDLVKAAQPMTNSDPGILGGIPGSDPVWGAYISNRIPNWAAKFFIDALIEKRRTLREIASRPTGRWRIPDDVPKALPTPSGEAANASEQFRTVMYTNPRSHKIDQMISKWSSWNFKPGLIVVECEPDPSFWSKLRIKLRHDGFVETFKSKLRSRQLADTGTTGNSAEIRQFLKPAEYASRHDIRLIFCSEVHSPEVIDAVRDYSPSVAIHAGAGILRKSILEIPKLGTLNAHMGIQPEYRGMNVAEWAAFNGDPVGCTVHLIDEGIDTGDILCIREIDVESVRDISTLRQQVDDAQVELLGEVLRYVASTGQLPPRREQKSEEGRQYFVIHAELAAKIWRE